MMMMIMVVVMIMASYTLDASNHHFTHDIDFGGIVCLLFYKPGHNQLMLIMLTKTLMMTL